MSTPSTPSSPSKPDLLYRGLLLAALLFFSAAAEYVLLLGFGRVAPAQVTASRLLKAYGDNSLYAVEHRFKTDSGTYTGKAALRAPSPPASIRVRHLPFFPRSNFADRPELIAGTAALWTLPGLFCLAFALIRRRKIHTKNTA